MNKQTNINEKKILDSIAEQWVNIVLAQIKSKSQKETNNRLFSRIRTDSQIKEDRPFGK